MLSPLNFALIRELNMHLTAPICLSIATVIVCGTYSTASAEIPNLSPAELQKTATQIVSGKVHRIYSNVERTAPNMDTIHNVAELHIRRVEKGSLDAPLLYIRFWRKRYVGDGLAPAGHYGHRGVPKRGDSVRVFLKKADDGGYDVLSPNGFEVIETSNNKGQDEPQ